MTETALTSPALRGLTPAAERGSLLEAAVAALHVPLQRLIRVFCPVRDSGARRMTWW